ncbi:IclR family transcriptional regulator [Corynebacterium tapiri]|uniref:IclR family transcriptional regulator n=1 Tax=Corynebacterium tapiri TaxID=1448266 RepID=A0A5C4U7Z5_9CORY|nr:IclR family transcriptional regulator [Corynebacterium tapiri]TNL99811.1 IclR family transcriptional regulator [Corynebacterium tapiri]
MHPMLRDGTIHYMGHYTAESGIKVLDRAIAIAAATAGGPRSLAQLCEDTGLPRATVHRLASALEVHQVLERTPAGLWQLGSMLTNLGHSLIDVATPIMNSLVEVTGESVQLYRHTGDTRTCVAAVEPTSGLRNTVPVGSQLTMTSGSAAKVFTAFSDEATRADLLSRATFDAAELEVVTRTHVAESVSEREVGLASLSSPVIDSTGTLVAVLSISGPAERLRPSPRHVWGAELAGAARRLSGAL